MFPLFCRHGFQLSQALWGRDYQLPGAEGLRADQTHRGGRRRGADVGRCQTAGWGAAAWPRPRPGNMGKRLSENGLYPPSNFNGNLMKMDLRAYYFQTKPHFLCHLFGTWKLKKWWWKMVKKPSKMVSHGPRNVPMVPIGWKNMEVPYGLIINGYPSWYTIGKWSYECLYIYI